MTFHLRCQLHKFGGNQLGLLSPKCDQTMQMAELKRGLRLEAEVLYQTGKICIDDANPNLDDF